MCPRALRSSSTRVAASLIGFAVLAARRPNVVGAVVGAIFVGVLLNGLTMLNVPYYTQDFVKGAVLVGALGLTYGLGRATGMILSSAHPTEGTLSMISRIRTALFATALLACLAAPSMADGLAGAPAPFDKGGVKLALVGYISAGDFFEAYQSGAVAQAKKLGVDLRIFPGKQDPAEERSQIEQAVNLGVKGIVIDHGLPESLKDVAQKALDAGVKVVAFDVNLDNPNIPQVEQSDHLLARLALEQALKDNGEASRAAYVYVAGFAPLDRRDEVWSEFKTKHPGIQEVARFGVVNGTTAASVADQAKAALRAHPEITVVFAPYDEFARGVKLAVNELGLRR